MSWGELFHLSVPAEPRGSGQRFCTASFQQENNRIFQFGGEKKKQNRKTKAIEPSKTPLEFRRKIHRIQEESAEDGNAVKIHGWQKGGIQSFINNFAIPSAANPTGFVARGLKFLLHHGKDENEIAQMRPHA